MVDVVLYPRALDYGLNALDSECDQITICSQQPTTYTEAVTTYALGSKNLGAGNVFGAEADATPNGRHVTSAAITDGAVTAAGTVAAWAAVDTANTRLLATGILTGGVAVRSGQAFVLGALTVKLPAVPDAYVGAGDIVSGAIVWWGLRAYSNAKIGTSAIRLRRDSDQAEQDFVTLSSGALDVASIASFKGADNLFIVKLYDQVGTNHFIQTTAAWQLSLILSGLGAKPVMRAAASNPFRMVSTNAITQAQPFTCSVVFNNTGGASSQYLVTEPTTPVQMSRHDGVNLARMYAGSIVNATAANSTWHAVQHVLNGAASDINVDGTVNTVNPGTSGLAAAVYYFNDNNGFAGFVGDGTEVGFWNVAFSAGQSTSMSSNQRDYWGF
jgi:hypothetical protein